MYLIHIIKGELLMKKRSVLLMVLLTFLTLGIYMIYWTCSFQNQLKKETGKGFGGLGHLIMIFLTFGIYLIYWQYAAGNRLEILGAKNYGLVYLLFVFVMLSWISPFIMQHQANKLK